ncbi:hypothetical protein R3P38DRAFT_2566723, partial [Favolaschia claudopus]
LSGAMIWQTTGSWDNNLAKGGMGIANNALNVMIDVLSGTVLVTGVAERVLRVLTVRDLEAPDTMLSSAVEMNNALKPLEKFSSGVGGLLNIAFGVVFILGGSQELEAGGSQLLNGRLDVSSGALMVTGGVLEIVGALGGSIAIPAIGQILAGIGLEFSMIKIWVGGAPAVGAFGQSLLDLSPSQRELETEDLTINYIRHVKACAVQAKISRVVTVSPDPRDGGIETNGSPYIISPFYDVSQLSDHI